MKKSFRLFPFLFLMLITLVSCSKKSGFDDPLGNQYPPVFDGYEQAGDAVSLYLQRAGQGEQFIRIENIVLMESGNKTYALVYYETNLGHSNILYEQEYQGQTLLARKHYNCTGTTCTCKVVATVSGLGEVDINCNCTSCTLTVTNY